MWFYIQLLILLSSSFYLYCWVAVSNDYVVFNKSIFEFLHFSFNWALLILYATAFAFCCQVIIFVVHLFSLDIIDSSCRLSRFSKSFIAFIGILSTIVYGIIALIWFPEINTVKLFTSLVWPYLHVAAVVLITCLFCTKLLISKEKCSLRFIFAFIFTYMFLCIVPFLLKSPCIKEGIGAARKPLILGHKGYPKIAPENTLMSFEEADIYDVDGYEADVAVSMDGIPFLVHDRTLVRTTDVGEVFPSRKNEHAESFKWPELQKLNAGKWFLRTDPYRTTYSFSQFKKKEIMKQKIMTLAELAHRAKTYNKKLIFDLRQPRVWNHPYMMDYISVIVETVLKSGIDQSQVLWISGPMYHYVLAVAPGFQQVYGDHIGSDEIAFRHISYLILEYNTITKEYVEMYKRLYNITMIAYTSSTKWTFSLAWCQGAYAVISDDAKMHRDLKRPIWSFNPQEYHSFWVPWYIICVLTSSIILFIHLKGSTRKFCSFFKVIRRNKYEAL